MKKMRFIAGILVLLLVLSVAMTGCTDKASVDSKDLKEELIVGQGADAKSLDPHATNDQPSSRVMTQIYDTLVVQNKDGSISPSLAKEWKQLDNLTWQFVLEKGVKFHNGEELKASDIKFTLERALASPTVAHILSSIDSVKIEDDYTFNITLKDPFAPILAHLAHGAASILNEKAVTDGGEDYGQNPVGTGPYKLSGWQVGDSIDLVANESYFKGVAPTSKIKFRNIPEGTNRSIALETGEVDIAYDIDPIDKSRVEGHSDLSLIEEPSLSIAYIGFNTNKAPYNKKEVRQAINYAIDREGIIESVLMGAGEVASSPLPPNVAMSNQKVDKFNNDIEKAKQLLKQAGLEKGFKTTLWTNDNQVRVRIAQIVQANLKEIGIEVEIEILEWGSYLDRTAAGEHDMFILGWTTVTADPDYGLYALFHSTQTGSAGNRAFYANSEVDRLLDLGKVETDNKKREEHYFKAQELIVADSPIATLYYSTHNAGINKKVLDFELQQAGSHELFGVKSTK